MGWPKSSFGFLLLLTEKHGFFGQSNSSQGRRSPTGGRETRQYILLYPSPQVLTEKNPKQPCFLPCLMVSKLNRIPSERPGHLFTCKSILLKHFKCTWVQKCFQLRGLGLRLLALIASPKHHFNLFICSWKFCYMVFKVKKRERAAQQ